RQERQFWTVGLGLSLLAAVFFGMATTNEKFLLNHMNLTSYLVFGWGTQVLVAFIFSWLIGRRKGYAEIRARKPYALLGLGGLIRAVSGLTFVLALVVIDNLSVVSALSGLKVIIAALLGWLVLREGQFALRKLGASMVAAIGVVIMFWRF